MAPIKNNSCIPIDSKINKNNFFTSQIKREFKQFQFFV
jgi:hypothetical protein